MTTNTDHVRNAHEHLRHNATSDPSDEVRERLRREELSAKRDLDQQAAQDQSDQDQTQSNE
jgi:hypothetical protein